MFISIIISFLNIFCQCLREDEENLRVWYGKTPCRRKRHRNAEAEEVNIIIYSIYFLFFFLNWKCEYHSFDFILRTNFWLEAEKSKRRKRKKRRRRKARKNWASNQPKPRRRNNFVTFN